MHQQLIESETTPSDLSPVARVGKTVTRVILFVVLVGILLNTATTLALPLWVVALLGAMAVAPMIYWPTLGLTVVGSYFLIAVIIQLG